MNNPRQRMISRREMIARTVAAACTSLPACAQVPISDPTGSKIRVFKDAAARARYMEAYDAVLREWSVPHESIHVPTRFGATHVVASGSPNATPVLLFPAMLTTATSWRPNIAALSEHFRTYAIDVIGEINKSEPVRPLRNRADCASWVADLQDGLNIERACIVGASLGGFLALNHSLANPERVDRIVLIGPTVLPMTWKLWFYAGLAMTGFEGPMDRWFANGVPFNPADASSVALWSANAEGAGRINNMSLGEIGEEEWREIRVPTLLLIGEREVIYRSPPREVLEHALRAIPGLAGHIVPGANHLAARTNPTFVNDQIIRFLHAGKSLDAIVSECWKPNNAIDATCEDARA